MGIVTYKEGMGEYSLPDMRLHAALAAVPSARKRLAAELRAMAAQPEATPWTRNTWRAAAELLEEEGS